MWSDQAINQLIGRIYDSALDTQQLHEVLHTLTEMLGMVRAMYWTPYETHSDRTCWVDYGFDPRDISDYFDYYYQFDHWAQAVHTRQLDREGSIADTDLIVPFREFRKTEFYGDCLRHVGITRALSVAIGQDMLNDVLHAITLHADDRHGGFRSEEIGLLKLLRPHFARANKLRYALQTSQIRQDTISDTLDRLDTVVMVCDADARIDTLNRSAELWLTRKQWACISMGRLSLHDPQRQARLEHYLKLPLAQWRDAGLIPIGRDANGQPCCLLRILPLPPAANQLLQTQPQPRFALTITLEQAPRLVMQLLQAVFQLTPAEARIASDLVSGLAPAEIAETRQLSIHTVRSALKTIYSKTGCRRQADLVSSVERLS